MELNFADFSNVEIDGVDVKALELDGVNVWTRIDLPEFTKHPNGGKVYDNQSFKSSVMVNANDGTVTYQWFINGIAQPNSNAPEYTFGARSAGNYSIRCEATNERGKAVSNSATLTVEISFVATHTLVVGSKNNWFGYDSGSWVGGMGSLAPRTISRMSGVIDILMFSRVHDYWSGFMFEGAPIGWRIEVSWIDENGTLQSEVSQPSVTQIHTYFKFTGAFRNYVMASHGKTLALRIRVV